MERFVIRGGRQLHGEINISGAKNAALAIIPAAILADGPCRIENIPDISDVDMMIRVLEYIGAEVTKPENGVLVIDGKNVDPDRMIPTCMTKKFRASYYLLGALLGKYGKANVAMPGGCCFGVRPIDLHIKGFEAMGASVVIDKIDPEEEDRVCEKHLGRPVSENGCIYKDKTPNDIVRVSSDGLFGAPVYMDIVSVGATVNIMLAAVMAKGKTVIENAAREPHIVDLANFLNSMGADVRGAGTDVIKILGVDEMKSCSYSIIPDQIEAGTYMTAVAAAGGDVVINNVIPKHLDSISSKLEECGVTVIKGDESVRIISKGGRVKPCRVKTRPHPGFPTDMQPQFAALLSQCDGVGTVIESVWETRFQYIDQLRKMGAIVEINDDTARITGVERLCGATVNTNDLRAGAAMVIAGLMADGVTNITNIRLIDRGYENLVEKLSNVNADIKREIIDD